jgi:hypothetical protein
LENSYLTQRIRNGAPSTTSGGGGDGGSNNGDDDGRVWVDFNALDVQGCWVMGGPNATCPWTNRGIGDEDEITRRYILVCLIPFS